MLTVTEKMVTVKEALHIQFMELYPSYADDVMIRRTGGNMNTLADGNIYHAIYYGLNAMGPHNTQVQRY